MARPFRWLDRSGWFCSYLSSSEESLLIQNSRVLLNRPLNREKATSLCLLMRAISNVQNPFGQVLPINISLEIVGEGMHGCGYFVGQLPALRTAGLDGAI